MKYLIIILTIIISSCNLKMEDPTPTVVASNYITIETHQIITDTFILMSSEGVRHQWELTGEYIVVKEVSIKMYEASHKETVESIGNGGKFEQLFVLPNGMRKVKYLGNDIKYKTI